MTEKRAKASASAGDIRGRTAALAVEERAQRQAVDQAPRFIGIEGRERQGPIPEELDQHAAGTHHHHRAEMRIDLGAEGELDACAGLRHGRYQDPRPQPPGQILIGSFHGRLRPRARASRRRHPIYAGCQAWPS